MTSDLFIKILTDQGPWALLVFYLLYRDLQKDQATRDVVNKNSQVLVELTTLIRERLPRAK
jgi:hypothetical protein